MLPLYSLPGFNNGKIFLFLSFFPTGSCSVSPAALLFVPKVRHQPWVFSPTACTALISPGGVSLTLIHHADDYWDLCLAFPKPSHQQGLAVPPLSPNLWIPCCHLPCFCPASLAGHDQSPGAWLLCITQQAGRETRRSHLCAPKRMEIQPKVTASQTQTHYKHSFQLRWFMDCYFPIASSISNYFSECHHLMMNLHGLRDVESLQDSRSVQISCIFQINSPARSYVTTSQCKPHAFSLKKPNFTMYEWTKKKFVKDVRLETFPAIGADNNSFNAER